MRAFWVAVESIDLGVIRLLDTVDRMVKRKNAFERAAEATGSVPEPTPAPKFEKFASVSSSSVRQVGAASPPGLPSKSANAETVITSS